MSFCRIMNFNATISLKEYDQQPYLTIKNLLFARSEWWEKLHLKLIMNQDSKMIFLMATLREIESDSKKETKWLQKSYTYVHF